MIAHQGQPLKAEALAQTSHLAGERVGVSEILHGNGTAVRGA